MHDRLRRRSQHVKVNFSGFDGQYLSGSQPIWEDDEPTDFFLHFDRDILGEEPNFLLISALIHQMMMDELRSYFPVRLRRSLRERYREKVSAEGPVPVEKLYRLLVCVRRGI
ncbi:MAG: hypothetical protein R3B54_15100 [Bdellovibrionota bacterium]